MSIHSISHLIASPFGLALLYLGYNSLTIDNYPYSIWMVVPITVLVLLYLFKPQLDYWWHTKFPIKFDKELSEFLASKNPYYASLEGEEKIKFEHRLNLYMEARDYKAIGANEQKDIPYDMKAMLASIPTQLTMHKEDYLIGDMDRIFLYKHPFPTPSKQFLHTVESHVEDGVFIFSLNEWQAATHEPKRFYNNIWYGYMDAFLKVFNDDTNSIEPYATFQNIEKIGKYTEEYILRILGLKAVDPLVVLCGLYFTHTEEMKTNTPQIFGKLQTFFS